MLHFLHCLNLKLHVFGHLLFKNLFLSEHLDSIPNGIDHGKEYLSESTLPKNGKKVQLRQVHAVGLVLLHVGDLIDFEAMEWSILSDRNVLNEWSFLFFNLFNIRS